MRLSSLWAFVPVFAIAAACGGSSSDNPSSPAGNDGGGIDGGGGDSAPQVDSGPACTAPQESCGGKCVNTKTDDKNCGMCGQACKVGEGCAAGKCVLSLGFAVRKLYLGDTNRDGTPSNMAWKQYGENIDGIVSTNVPNGECILQAGAPSSTRSDGDNGIDNSFGKVIIPFMQPFTPSPSKNVSDAIEAGSRTPVIVFGANTGKTSPFAAGFAVLEKSPVPTWDGKDSRQLAETSAKPDGSAKIVFMNAKVDPGGAFVSGDLVGTFNLDISFGGAALQVPINKAHVTMTIAPDGSKAANGVISGVIPTEDLVNAFAKTAGAISKQLCDGSTIESIKQTIRQASDILKDGTQDETKTCDGISIGVGFEAVAVTVSGVAPKEAPQPDPCK